MEPNKSILKRRNSATTHPPSSRGTTPTNHTSHAPGARHVHRDKKRVEITSPPQSVASNDTDHLATTSDHPPQKPKMLMRPTPLPRVALLSTKPSKKSISRESSRIALKLKSIRLRAKRSPSIPSHKVKRSKRRSSSSRKSDAEEPETRKETNTIKPTRNTHDYVKEIGTINNIIKSVVNPVTAIEKGEPLVEGIVRPLSAEELGQLLKSIGNVANIHENIDITNTANTEEIPVQSEDHDLVSTREGRGEKRKSKSRKSKNRRHISSQKSIKLANYLPLIKQAGSGGLPHVHNPSGGKLSREQILINSKASRSAPSPPKTFRSPVRKLKSMKSQVKALIKEQRSAEKTKSKSKKGSKRRKSSKDLNKDENADTPGTEPVDSVMSDLDLIKSAILNKRYYEESMALAHSSSKESVTVEGTTKKTKRSLSTGGKKNKSQAGGKKHVSHASIEESLISPSRSDASINSRLEFLRDLKKKTENSPDQTATYFQSTLNKILKDDNKPPAIRPPAAATRPVTTNIKKDTLELVKTEADNKKHLKDVLVNYSHVIRGPDPGAVPNYNNHKKDFQFSEDGELYFTQRILTAPRFNAMSAELHDDNTKFKEHIEKTKSIQKRFGQGTNEEPNHGIENVSKVPLTAVGKETKKSPPVNPGNPKTPYHAPKTAKPLTAMTNNDRTKRDNKPTSDNTKPKDTINELYSIKNTLQKNLKEPVVKNIARAHSGWQQQSLYPSAYPSVVNAGLGSRGLFDTEERWSMLNQRTQKKNEELKDKRLDIDEIENVQRRMHPAVPKKFEVDDENKILDSFATYMKIKGNNGRPTTARDPKFLKNKF